MTDIKTPRQTPPLSYYERKGIYLGVQYCIGRFHPSSTDDAVTLLVWIFVTPISVGCATIPMVELRPHHYAGSIDESGEKASEKVVTMDAVE